MDLTLESLDALEAPEPSTADKAGIVAVVVASAGTALAIAGGLILTLT